MDSCKFLLNKCAPSSQHLIMPGINKYVLIYPSFPTIVDGDNNQVIGCLTLGTQPLDVAVPSPTRLENVFS